MESESMMNPKTARAFDLRVRMYQGYKEVARLTRTVVDASAPLEDVRRAYARMRGVYRHAQELEGPVREAVAAARAAWKAGEERMAPELRARWAHVYQQWEAYQLELTALLDDGRLLDAACVRLGLPVGGKER
jgi:hypothetical protein